jgi:hypothetical protein
LSVDSAIVLELELFHILEIFILEYLHIEKEILWTSMFKTWDPSLSMKFICVSYALYTYTVGNFI